MVSVFNYPDPLYFSKDIRWYDSNKIGGLFTLRFTWGKCSVFVAKDLEKNGFSMTILLQTTKFIVRCPSGSMVKAMQILFPQIVDFFLKSGRQKKQIVAHTGHEKKDLFSNLCTN